MSKVDNSYFNNLFENDGVSKETEQKQTLNFLNSNKPTEKQKAAMRMLNPEANVEEAETFKRTII